MNPDSSSGRWSIFKLAVVAFALLMVLGVVVVGVVIGLRVQAVRRASPTFTLSDGTRVQLLGTAPSSQAFSSETPWLKRLRKILPATLQKRWLPTAFIGTCGAGFSNGLIIYLRETRPTSAWTTPYLFSAEPEDDAGFHYTASGGSCSFGLPGNEQILGLGVTAYPRRQPSFLLHLRDSRGVVLSTLRIANTNTGPFSEWHPLPLPQTVTNGPATLTLLSVAQRLYGGHPYLSPQWRYHSDETGWSNARVRTWTCLDATGNEGQLLSPLEPAWKIRAQIARPNASDFGPAEKVTLSNLPVKGSNEFVALDRSNLVSGLSLDVQVLCGPGTLVISNGTGRFMDPSLPGRSGHSSSSYGSGQTARSTDEWSAGTNSYFLVNVANTQRDDEIRFFLRDDLGRNIKIDANGWSGSSTGTRVYQPQFTPPADAKSLTLEVVVDRPRFFDFLIDPKDVKPPAQ